MDVSKGRLQPSLRFALNSSRVNYLSPSLMFTLVGKVSDKIYGTPNKVSDEFK